MPTTTTDAADRPRRQLGRGALTRPEPEPVLEPQPDPEPDPEPQPETAGEARPPEPEQPETADGSGDGRFTVRLANFEGPFDLLLQLISKHKMDVTEVALSKVTNEFMAHLSAMGPDWDLDQTTEFLVVAATLLDLKAARLLPSAEVENEEDLALLEARDLLFARLLQYKAYKEAAAHIAELEAVGGRRYPRAVTLEPRYLGLLPEVQLGMDADAFAELAAAVFRPKPPPPTVGLDHMHASPVSVAEHTDAMRALLAERGSATFGELVAGCTATMEVVARFLGLLNLFREARVTFEQDAPFGRLEVRWVAAEDVVTGAGLVTDEEYA